METESVYLFNGKRFIEHANFKEFKDQIQKKLNYNDDSAESLTQFYENYYEKKGNDFNELNRTLFENIMYGRLTNIFVHKISDPSSLGIDLFKKAAKKIIDSFKVSAPITIQDLMSVNGFYLLDGMSVPKIGSNFIAGFDYKQDGSQVTEVRFLVGRSVTLKKAKETYPGYMLGAVEINLKKKICSIFVKHTSNVLDEGDEAIKSVQGYHKFILQNFVLPLTINLVESDAEARKEMIEKDRQGMFEFCKSLYEELIDDVRTEVITSAEKDVISVTRKIVRILKELGKKPTLEQQSVLSTRINYLILGLHVENNISDKEMAQKAVEKDLLGFPTNIDYKNSRMNRSSTGTSVKSKPIAKSETLYSLLTDFEKARMLNKWSLSWFRDPKNKNEDEIEQTSIESTSFGLHIRFKGRNFLGKELIQHVIGTIDQCRS
ncbi:hypothetical protein [Paenibacillus sp. FSL K6-0108]|uniref:hypothetical protein n=1 Tax=Paenibacillus sp. FSL K6-0108 TaxID=2921417 RepID=UPI003250C36A